MKHLFDRAEHGMLRSVRDLHILLDVLPVPVSWATLPGREVRFINDAFQRVFGYAVEDIPTIDLFIERIYVQAAHRELCRHAWRAAWESPERRTGLLQIPDVEVDMRCTDGRVVTALHRGVLLFDLGIGLATFDDISDRKRAELSAWSFAYEDFLTGLPNRRRLMEYWREHLHASSTHSSPPLPGAPSPTFILLDLDRFKMVNDQHGHDAGDHVLCVVADRLRASVRDSDLVCRFGGDEFGVVLAHPISTVQVEQLCQRIRTAIGEPIVWHGHPLAVGTSMGVCAFGADNADFDTVFQRADRALYRCKQSNRGNWCWSPVVEPA